MLGVIGVLPEKTSNSWTNSQINQPDELINELVRCMIPASLGVAALYGQLAQ